MKDMNESYEPKYLVNVSADRNANKFYRMIPDSTGLGFNVEYGRIGAPTFRTAHYPIEKWYDKYYEKTDKGYVDQTSLVKAAVEATTGEDGFKAIEDKDVNELIKALRKYANDTIKANYTISQSAITQEMLDQAKEHIDKLNSILDKFDDTYDAQSAFNGALMNLFRTIPRKMNKVNEYLLKDKDKDEAAKIIDREQKLYDVLLANYQTQKASTNAKRDGNAKDNNLTETILEKLGLECKLVNDQATIDQIKSHMGQVASKFKRAFIVVNKNTQDKYKSFMSQFPNCTTKLFFHGSKNENFWSILKNGLLLNPKASVTGKLLGNGVYFAKKAAKSLGYTSLQGSYWASGNSKVGYMAVFAVAIDPSMAYDVSTYAEMDACHGMTWEKLQKVKPGATHVYAHKQSSSVSGSWLREDEICVYREDQCTIRYLIELTV